MARSQSLKFALLAASALVVTAGSAAHAGETAVATPIHTEAALVVTHAADETGAREAAPLLKHAGLAAAVTGALAALYRLIGGARVKAFFGKAGPATAKAARTVAAAPVKVARAVGRAAASPFRFLLALLGLGLFALTGVGLYDVEWLGGLIAGAAVVSLFWFAASGMKRAFVKRLAQAARSARRER